MSEYVKKIKEEKKLTLRKKIRRFLRKIFKKENIIKLVVLISGLALILTTILPYIL